MILKLALFLLPIPQLWHRLENQQPANAESLAAWQPPKGTDGAGALSKLHSWRTVII